MAAIIKLVEHNGPFELYNLSYDGPQKTIKNNSIIRCKKADDALVDNGNPIPKPNVDGNYNRSFTKSLQLSCSGGDYNSISNPTFYISGDTGTGVEVFIYALQPNSSTSTTQAASKTKFYYQGNSIPTNDQWQTGVDGFGQPIINSTVNIKNFSSTKPLFLYDGIPKMFEVIEFGWVEERSMINNQTGSFGAYINLYMRVGFNASAPQSPTSNLSLFFSWDET